MNPSRASSFEPDGRRGRGERGSAVVTALVLLFAFTAGGVIWLSRDVNRVITNRSAAQSIAFQSARAGAQQVDVGSLRGSGEPTVVLNEERARVEGRLIADELFGAYGVSGTSSMTIDGDTVTVTVTIEDPDGDATATGSVQAQTGP
ncbi:hypothetical protein [Ilumatobacter sp.]|uniref:hypothetical protein n=1 Tax=Ilumatobacter sp. TaxID=1967498 RepID=UPI003AF8FA56